MRGLRGFRTRRYVQLEDTGFTDAQFRRPVYPSTYFNLRKIVIIVIV